MRELAYYIPIATFAFSLYFIVVLWRHYRRKRGATYLLWWLIGIITYGIGTFTESYHALFDWDPINFKAWYISGALLGGAPLAQGTVYLLMKRRTANFLSIGLVAIIVLAAVSVLLSPLKPEAVEINRLTGGMLSWQWTRTFSPFINLYALTFLAGGAVYSAWKYAKAGNKEARYVGNIFIAIGALLPGIGGTFTRFGYEEVLFVTELIGILLIFRGYVLMKGDKMQSVHITQVSKSRG